MANNLTSYNRFTTLPQNISQYGATTEEFALQRGQPDPDPVLSPMASPKAANNQLALGRSGSDKLRLTQPSEPVFNPYEGPRPTLVLSRNAVAKLTGSVVGQLHEMIQSGFVGDENLQGQMEHSLQRVSGLAEFLNYQNQLTDTIYARTLSVSKG